MTQAMMSSSHPSPWYPTPIDDKFNWLHLRNIALISFLLFSAIKFVQKFQIYIYLICWLFQSVWCWENSFLFSLTRHGSHIWQPNVCLLSSWMSCYVWLCREWHMESMITLRPIQGIVQTYILMVQLEKIIIFSHE